MLYNRVKVRKHEMGSKFLALQHVREPVLIIGPHVTIRNLIHVEPLRLHLLRLTQLSRETIRLENVTLEQPFLVLVIELEEQNTNLLWIGGSDTKLLLQLALCTLGDRLSRFDLSTGTVPLALTEASFLHAQEQLVVLVDEDKCQNFSIVVLGRSHGEQWLGQVDGQ